MSLQSDERDSERTVVVGIKVVCMRGEHAQSLFGALVT